MDSSHLDIIREPGNDSLNITNARNSSVSACKKSGVITAIVLGAIILLVGFFLLLATIQALPHGMNAMSQWGVGSNLATGIIMGLGVLSIGYGLIHWCHGNKIPSAANPPSKFQIEEREIEYSGTPNHESNAPAIPFNDLENNSHSEGIVTFAPVMYTSSDIDLQTRIIASTGITITYSFADYRQTKEALGEPVDLIIGRGKVQNTTYPTLLEQRYSLLKDMQIPYR
ncbi:MAG TPA: hypothetical protein VIH61_05100, partial [Waddliaceae bacterium]